MATASPRQLVQMLFDGAAERLNQARGAMQHNDHETKARALNGVVDILTGLQASLDHEQGGGEIAGNLEALYDYMQRRLFRVSVDNDVDALREVTDLLETLRQAWATMKVDESSTL